PHCAGAHERSCMEGDQADERWLALPDPARARWRSPHVRRTKGSALMEVLTTARNVLVARRPPSGTSVLRPPATPWRQPQHPRSSALRQSRSRTVYNSLAVPLGVGLAISKLLAHTDPNAACISASQPLLLECCDDRLNPPWIARSSRATTAENYLGCLTSLEARHLSAEERRRIKNPSSVLSPPRHRRRCRLPRASSKSPQPGSGD